LRFASGDGSALEHLQRVNLPSRLEHASDPVQWWDWLFALGGALASHTSQVSTILRDSVTGLPDRKAFEAVLSDQLERAGSTRQPLSLLLINPDQFSTVNEQMGREAGDRCVQEISARLRPALRITDLVARYGGVVFAAILIDTPESEAEDVAARVMDELSRSPFLDDELELQFSIGLGSVEAEQAAEARSLDLVRRTDQALNAAKRAGGGTVARWHDGLSEDTASGLDRLSGIFTGNMSKDYRNMALLRDASDIVALHSDFGELAKQVAARLFDAFNAERVGLFKQSDRGDLELIYGLTRRSATGSLQSRVETVDLSDWEKESIVRSIEEHRIDELGKPPADDPNAAELAHDRAGFTVALRAREQTIGCLLIEGRTSVLTLDSGDSIFLGSLAAQLSVALDRARLAEAERSRQDLEHRRLRAELSDLRKALQQVKMVYRSSQMEDLVATVRRVAPTDATVLITGESGTGKELLSRTLHELSPRKNRPLVIVDCGAIASTLIESELFGHEKGAYTGAQQRRTGRLVEAREGSVLLDEIGELPLEVQSKLLRFVQDKQFTTVGGSRPQSVDVRIIAATNRDLAAEVKAGRFREDLYHRLNVVSLEIPPLRERPDDVLYLARHFLELFSVQYQKATRHLTADAEEALLAHAWPGNVRELHNRILQSVILSDSTEIYARDLGLDSREGSAQPPRPAPAEVPTEGIDELHSATATDRFSELRQALAAEIGRASQSGTTLKLPLGEWLRDDLLIETDIAVSNVARQAAEVLGMPESTYRRRLRNALDQEQTGLTKRSETWPEVRQLLHQLALTSEEGDGGLMESSQRLLLEEILQRFPDDVKSGSQLLGVSPPTYRRRVKDLETSD
ncbi:MAG: sigma 54-interacting transcriptional regulator, partial [Acidobacteriota bacterium]